LYFVIGLSDELDEAKSRASLSLARRFDGAPGRRLPKNVQAFRVPARHAFPFRVQHADGARTVRGRRGMLSEEAKPEVLIM
jgi:hypothetical protein